ncbi:reverse transcriptase domain-containing protein, partial [Tanacetum coccineum]
IIEHLAKDGEKNVFWSINEEVRESLLNLKNMMYHSRQILRISRLKRIQDHCMTLKNMTYPHQPIRRIRYFGQHSEQARFTTNMPKEKEEAQQQKFLENLRQLHINIPFIEALVQMPKYAKYLKNLLTNKSKLEEACTVMINERCSAVLLSKLPSKEKDLGCFTIPCQISNLHIDNALADLRASISLMPYTMYEKLGLGEPKPLRMSLELADRSIQYPRGIVENVLIKVGDDEVIYDMEQSMKKPFTKDDECYSIEDLDETINKET